MIKIAETAHEWALRKHPSPIDLAVDMTAGRGNDTLFLAGVAKRVVAFDIQEEAIRSTRERLGEHGFANVFLVLDDHRRLAEHIHDPIDLAFYNLGYLPNGFKTVQTTAESTVSSLKMLLPMLSVGGAVWITCYPKHNNDEAAAVLRFCQTLPSPMYDVMKISVVNKELSPFLLSVERLK
jgi:tRNA G37 N-methylase Trm5